MINGVEIRFPLVPYASQIAVMSQVIRAVTSKQCALVESPTGSGKSLALLCSALAWCEKMASGEDEGWGTSGAERGAGSGEMAEENRGGRNGRGRQKTLTPKVFYATRTHSQIAQIVGELARTSYKSARTVVLASREHYCVNKSAKKSGNVNEECRKLMDVSAEGRGCYHAGKAASMLAEHAKNQVDPLDIEDLVTLGRMKKGCPYFASKIMAESAELVFCPYNYILDPRTRAAMDIDIEGSLIIFDEAHNIEDTAREAASEETWLEEIAYTVERLKEVRRRATVNLIETELLMKTMNGLYEWFLRFCDDSSDCYGLQQNPQAFETSSATIRGEQSLQALENIGLTRSSVSVVMEALVTVTKHNQENKDPKERVPGGVFATCEKVLNPIRFLLSKGEATARDYRIVFTKTTDPERVATTQHKSSQLKRLPIDEVVKINFWSLNPALAFRDLVGENGARSVILTSGTLAPLNSFASELGVEFPIRLEAQHCIDMKRQVYGSVVGIGPNNVAMNAGFKSRSDYGFQDELGTSLKEWAQVTPHGMLMFFPSYSLMDNIIRRWRETGMWQTIEKASGKRMFQEPSKSSHNYGKKPLTLEQVMVKYYDAIAKSVRAAKHPYAPAPETATCRGAILFAVCRGKISEGIDFADANARAVISVGIPYPNIKDSLVAEKRSYNDEGRGQGLLSGSQWYDQQAYRALNQAVGRCLRHRHDHGAIILVDERFNQRNIHSLPKWLRPAIVHNPGAQFADQLASLKQFFAIHAENPPGEDEPASKARSERAKLGKRERVSIGGNSPRKAMRNTPITHFFSKTSASGEVGGDPSVLKDASPMKSGDDDHTYKVPILEDEDIEIDLEDLNALVQGVQARSPSHVERIQEISPEAMCAQIMDGIEWDDDDDEEVWLEQAMQATQTVRTMSKMESTTPTTETKCQDVVSPLKAETPSEETISIARLYDRYKRCASCGNALPSQIITESNERVIMKSSYLDATCGADSGASHNFISFENGEGVCHGFASDVVDFDQELRIAFRKLKSCDCTRLIGFQVEATNVEYAHLLDRKLMITRDSL